MTKAMRPDTRPTAEAEPDPNDYSTPYAARLTPAVRKALDHVAGTAPSIIMTRGPLHRRGGDAMSAPRTTRRGMLATAGLAAAAAAALVATAATESGDARLLALADELADLHRQTEAATDAEMDRALGAYWAVADQIAELPATTPQGIRAKARVLRSVVWQLGPDEGGHIADHTEALIAAVLGEGAP